MVNNIPQTLPQCELFDVLNEKSSQKHDTDFNFFGHLDNFRRRVSGEILQINRLFPEYTPHDEQYHLRHLFHIADRVLGRDRFEDMNSAELFILSVALYGHDWGMAVSDIEKEYILTGKLSEGRRVEDFWILPEEHRRFSDFVKKEKLEVEAESCLTDIPIEMWREYVRQTHALRSGERVRRFFEPIDGGVADAASRVCMGHWEDFEDLQRYESYPPNYAALGETVNLRALAIYLRLIDLLDLAEDRTPYVIWKFVAPRDPYSKMEWAKHRALRPVTCPQYQQGRVIQVDGSTDDHEVYAALEDLRIYCEEQLRGCNDLLAQMNDPRHKLDLYHIDWRVAPRGFRPVSIQFEFDRTKMFEILSNEIYQGDSYVFLRELLQNSIDAIRMRREILQRNGIDPGDLGEIHVTVEHGCNGDSVVTWRDDGIGMDEHIVRNYLAVAGKSFYQSEDFEREGLKMDPISRFGIGILSCFMVADRIEIETYRDPYLSLPSEPLKIIIPAIHRQFRIEILPREGAQVGTTVRVFVKGKKLEIDDDKNETAKPLDVIAYLSVVAGFVEFPIVVSEGDLKVIILHPKQDAEAARQRFGQQFRVRQLDLGYPWEMAFLPQDLQNVREVLREKCWDIASDLGLEGYDGVLTYLVPINDEIDLIRIGHNESEALKRGQIKSGTRFRWSEEWGDTGYFESRRSVGVSSSGQHLPTFAVYRDGILLAKSSPPLDLQTYRDLVPIRRLIANLPKSNASKIDLARTQIIGQTEHWASPIRKAHLRQLSHMFLDDLLALDPVERLYQLGRLAAFHDIRVSELWDIIPHNRWPLLFLEAGGHLSILEWQELARDTIHVFPTCFRREIEKSVLRKWWLQKEYKGFLTQWDGDQSIIPSVPFISRMPDSIKTTVGISWVPVTMSYSLGVVRFLKSPWKGDPPLLQLVMSSVENPKEPVDDIQILEKTVKDPILLNLVERARLNGMIRIPAVVEFSQPFQQFFAYGNEFLNLKHPITQALLRIIASLELAKSRNILPRSQLGCLEDALTLRGGFFEELPRIWSLAQEMQLGDVHGVQDLTLTSEEFVPGTYGMTFRFWESKIARVKVKHEFGKPVVQDPPD